MFIRIFKGGKNRQYEYVYVLENVRDKKGRVKQRTVEKLGRKDLLLASDPQAIEKIQQKYGGSREQKDAKSALIRIEETTNKIQNTRTDSSVWINLRNGHYVVRHIWRSVLGLHRKFGHLQKSTKYQFDLDNAAYFMTATKIMNPKSINSTYDDQEQYLGNPISGVGKDALYDLYGIIKEQKDSLFGIIGRALNSYLPSDRASLVFYDVTNAYFETSLSDEEKNYEQKDFEDQLLEFVKECVESGELSEDCFDTDGMLQPDRLPVDFMEKVEDAHIRYLRQRGMSKERRYDSPLVSVALIIDRYGCPMDFKVFAGNCSEYTSMESAIKEFKKKYDIEQSIVVADKGLNSGTNLKMLQENNLGFLMSQKLSDVGPEMINSMLDQSKYQYIDPEDKDKGRYQLVDKWTKKSKAGPIDCTLVFTYSEKRKQRDLKILQLWRQMVLDKMESKEKIKIKKSSWASLAKIQKEFKDGAIILGIDEHEYKRREKLCGYAALIYKRAPEKQNTELITNHQLTGSQIAAHYHRLNQIEECFRIMKSNLGLRPMFVWNSDHIRGHITICVLALLVIRLIQLKLKEQGTPMTVPKICRVLKESRLTVMRGLNNELIVHPCCEGLEDFRRNHPNCSLSELLKILEEEHNKPRDIDLIMKACGMTPLRGTYGRNELGRCMKTVFESDLDMVGPLIFKKLFMTDDSLWLAKN